MRTNPIFTTKIEVVDICRQPSKPISQHNMFELKDASWTIGFVTQQVLRIFKIEKKKKMNFNSFHSKIGFLRFPQILTGLYIQVYTWKNFNDNFYNFDRKTAWTNSRFVAEIMTKIVRYRYVI